MTIIMFAREINVSGRSFFLRGRFLFKEFIYLFLERGGGQEDERERDIDVREKR